MKKIGVTVALGLMLAGCVSSQNAQNEEYARLQAGVQEAIAACRAAVAARKISSQAAGAQCVANAEAPLASTWGQNADLHTMRATQIVAIWERVDKGQLTVAQANAETAQLKAAINSEVQRRNNASRAVAAQEQAASAAYMPNYMNPAPYQPRYCSRFGISVTCF